MKQSKSLNPTGSVRALVAASLSLSLCLNSVAFARNSENEPVGVLPVITDFVPKVPDLDPSAPLPKDASPESLPPSLLKVARERALLVVNAPENFQRLLFRKVKTYFVKSRTSESGVAPVAQDLRPQLLADAITVFREFESADDSRQFDEFANATLAPFIASLNADLIATPVRRGVVAEPIGEWTVQELVVKKMVGHLSRYKDFSRRALDLVVNRKHLKRATHVAGVIVTWGVLHHFFPNATMTTTVGAANAVWFAVMAGPIATVTTTAAGFFVRPTTELVKVMGARLTGGLERRMNEMYDRVALKYLSSTNAEKNESVRVATFEGEHTDFAGMTAEDQLKNWARGLNMFILVQNLFGRLLRDTHHGGRDLMMLAWTDSQNISQLVELLDTKEHVLQSLQMSILAPYRNAMVNREDMAAKNEFNARVRRFDELTERVWLNPDATQDQLDVMAAEIETAAEALRQYGLDDFELNDLLDIQRRRGSAIGKLITATAIGHLRAFYGAERNRNLADDARKIALAIQVGLGSEGFTEKYLPLVRRQLRLMGMEYSNADKPSAVMDAKTIKYEDCVVKELRKALGVPAGARAETYACVNALIGFHANDNLLADEQSPVTRLLRSVRSQGKKMEASGVIKFADTTLKDPARVRHGAQQALARCG